MPGLNLVEALNKQLTVVSLFGCLNLWRISRKFASATAEAKHCKCVGNYRTDKHNQAPNDQAQRRGRNAKESSSRLIRVRCSALLGGDSREGELIHIRTFAGVFYGDSDDVASGV